MKTIHFSAFKISHRIPLDKVSACFRMPALKGRRSYVLLADSQLDFVFLHKTSPKYTVLYDFGSIVFVNFSTEEIRIFLHYLESEIEGLDYTMFTRFSEEHTITINNDGSFILYKDAAILQGYSDSLIPVIASVPAKSVAFDYIESDIETLLDKAESVIHFMSEGHLRARYKKYASVTTQILRFQYESAGSIMIFDRPGCADASILSRNCYDILSGYYELTDRFSILDRKTKELWKISRSYLFLSYRQRENRLILFEVFLLALFPLSYLLQYLFDTVNIHPILQIFTK